MNRGGTMKTRSQLWPVAMASRYVRVAMTLSIGIGSMTPIGVHAQTNCVSSAPGLVSWWQAEGNANDAVGGNPGVLFNGAGYTNGMVGQAFSLDGVNDHIQVADLSNLHCTNGLT